MHCMDVCVCVVQLIEHDVTSCSRYPGIWHRFVSLEARASLRQNLFTIIYLPIVYTVFGLILGEFQTLKYFRRTVIISHVPSSNRHDLPIHKRCPPNHVRHLPTELLQLSLHELHHYESTHRAAETIPPRTLRWNCQPTRANPSSFHPNDCCLYAPTSGLWYTGIRAGLPELLSRHLLSRSACVSAREPGMDLDIHRSHRPSTEPGSPSLSRVCRHRGILLRFHRSQAAHAAVLPMDFLHQSFILRLLCHYGDHPGRYHARVST